MLGITEDYEAFDSDIIIHINAVFTILRQLGVGPTEGFSITDSGAVWSDFVGDTTKLELIKSYVYLRVRLLFDPPTSSAYMSAMERMISEFEWRLNVTVDPGEE